MAKYKNVTTGLVVEDNDGRLDGKARWKKLTDEPAPEARPKRAPRARKPVPVPVPDEPVPDAPDAPDSE